MKLIWIFILFCLQGIPAMAEESFSCPTGEAVHSFTISKREKLVICSDSVTSLITGYEAYLFRDNKRLQKLFIGSEKTPVKFHQTRGQVYETSHLNIRGKYHPLFKEKIACGTGTCLRKDKECIFDQTELHSPLAEDIEIEKRIYRKGSQRIEKMTVTELAQMSTFAFSGRKLAVDFFTAMPAHPLMEEQATKFYQHMKKLLNQMISEACLKISNG